MTGGLALPGRKVLERERDEREGWTSAALGRGLGLEFGICLAAGKRALNARKFRSHVPAQRFVLCTRHSHLRCQKPCGRPKAFSVSLPSSTPANPITQPF